MGFPTEKTVSAGSRFQIALVPSGGSTPTPYTLTLEATAASGATAVSLSADSSVDLQHDTIFKIGTVPITLVVPDAATLNDVVTISTTAGTVQCQALTAAINATGTATVYAFRELLGITELSPSPSLQTVDTTDMRSGFGNSLLPVGVDRTVTVNGQKVTGDRAFYEIIHPYLHQDTTIQQFLYARATMANGDIAEGLARLTTSSMSNQVRNVFSYNLTANFEGNNYQFTDGDAALFA